MKLFATDRDRLAFLLETDAALDLDFETLEALAGEVPEEQPPEKRPKYITNYIGSKQKLVDWIWKHTPDGVDSVVDAFSGSAVVAYMYKTKGLRVLANDRLHYCHHAARAIIENDRVRLSDEDLEALLADNPKAGTFVRDNFKGIFFAKGVIKNYGTGGILLTAAQSLDEVLLIPDEEVGKMPVRENLKTEAIEQKTRFKTGWLVWSEMGQGVTRPDILAKIKILG